ncbi:MAG: BON domain-containing protein [Chloroflexi bacterium]|nr:BON domain-containing protein [Chloroflexota bacterium]
MPLDRDLLERVQAALAPLAFRPIDVTVDDDGVVYLAGTVRSGREKAEAQRLVEQVRGVPKVVNNLLIAETVPMRLNVEGQPLEDPDLQEVEEAEAVIEPDLKDNIGTTDVMESDSENEPFFPPTDPVVLPTDREEGGFTVIGGFAPTSDDNVSDAPDHPPEVYHTDDEIADDVRRALRRNAGTASLILLVGVRNGIVYLRGKVQSLEDVDQAEAVAGDVPGVLDVREELEIA